jgi:hypothetical protein
LGITLNLKSGLWQNIYHVSIKEDEEIGAGLACAGRRVRWFFFMGMRGHMAGFMQGVDNRPGLS